MPVVRAAPFAHTKYRWWAVPETLPAGAHRRARARNMTLPDYLKLLNLRLPTHAPRPPAVAAVAAVAAAAAASRAPPGTPAVVVGAPSDTDMR